MLAGFRPRQLSLRRLVFIKHIQCARHHSCVHSFTAPSPNNHSEIDAKISPISQMKQQRPWEWPAQGHSWMSQDLNPSSATPEAFHSLRAGFPTEASSPAPRPCP